MVYLFVTIIALMVSLSRLYSGVHTFVDIIIGGVLGLCIYITVFHFYEREIYTFLHNRIIFSREHLKIKVVVILMCYMLIISLAVILYFINDSLKAELE